MKTIATLLSVLLLCAVLIKPVKAGDIELPGYVPPKCTENCDPPSGTNSATSEPSDLDLLIDALIETIV